MILKISDELLPDILVSESYVSDEDMKKAVDFAKKNNTTVLDYLFTQNILTNDLLGQALAEYYKIPYFDLNTHELNPAQVLKLPEELAVKYNILFLMENKDQILLATDDPTQPEMIAALQQAFPGKKILFAFSLPDDIKSKFVFYRKTLETRFASILQEKKRVAPELVDEIFKDAIFYRASDIHFEPMATEVLVRFRIDGVLQDAGRVTKEYYDNILNLIKVLAHIRTDEHLSAQDGAIRYGVEGGGSVDLRVSIIPTVNGEKVVIRLLSQYISNLSFSDLGLSYNDHKMLDHNMHRQFGMILVTGPTGSGKTTTLYAVLKAVKNPGVNITTIEDPVEYKIAGVNQIQVNEQTNLTFAKGLRSIMRQDPNIILVGEIRDKETSEIAVNAALTGHLLLSTFHANDASTAVPRLLDMGVEPFLLSSTLKLIIAQRLVRRVCENCRHGVEVSKAALDKKYPYLKTYFPEKSYTFYEGKGCQSCNYTGFKGRIAIYELISISTAIQELIVAKAPAQEIWKVAEKEGSRSLFLDGLDKVRTGVTTLDELLRIARPF